MKCVFQEEYDGFGNDLPATYQSKPVAYRQRFVCPDEGPSSWVLTESNILAGRPGWEVVPLYTHSDAAEVESIKADRDDLQRYADELNDERCGFETKIDKLYAKLAEAQERLRTQDDLLSQAYQHDIGTTLKREIRAAALPTSAEPKQP